MENKRKMKMPNALVVLFILLIIMALLTYVIPAGQFSRMELPTGQEVIDPNSFQFVEPNPTSMLEFWTSIPKGFIESGAVIAFTLIIAGTVEVIKGTGLINVLVTKLSKRFAKNGIWLIPILVLGFGLVAAFVGTQELMLVYLPIILPLITGLGFNPMTALAIVLVSTTIGFSSAFTNPFTVGIAHQITGLPMFSGMWYRIIVFIIFYVISCVYIMRYAKKIWQDPSTKVEGNDSLQMEDVDFTLRHKIIAIVVALLFAYIIYSVLTYGWGMVEMAGSFVAIGIVAGLIGGMDGDGIVKAFVEGAKGVLVGAILIGVASGVSVIMEEALIIDTLVYYFGELLQTLPVYLSAIAIFIFITLFNFLVPSGSGKALVTIPIISPLASIVGLNQQVAVLAFQLSDGLTNIIYPTSGAFMATLSIANVDWGDWAKFYGKLLLILSLTSIVLIVVAQLINYGPF